jgi:hypothetical protein
MIICDRSSPADGYSLLKSHDLCLKSLDWEETFDSSKSGEAMAI